MLTLLFQSYLMKSFFGAIPQRAPLNEFLITFESVQSKSLCKRRCRQCINIITAKFTDFLLIASRLTFCCGRPLLSFALKKGWATGRKEISTSKHESEFSNSDAHYYFFQSGWRLTWITLTLFFPKAWGKWKIRNINQHHSQLSACKTSLNLQEISQIHALLFYTWMYVMVYLLGCWKMSYLSKLTKAK